MTDVAAPAQSVSLGIPAVSGSVLDVDRCSVDLIALYWVSLLCYSLMPSEHRRANRLRIPWCGRVISNGFIVIRWVIPGL